MQIKDYILSGQYDVASQMCEQFPKTKLRDEMLNLAYDTESMSIYAFSQYMLQKSDEKEWMNIIIEMMINPLCFIEGAYSIALYYARELIKYDKTVDNLERLLFFHNIPEKLICDEEAKLIAKELLNMDADNKVALAIK